MNKNGKKTSCRCLILEKKTLRWAFWPLNPKARIKETSPKFNMVHLEMMAFQVRFISKIPKGSPIFRRTSRLGLGGVDKKIGWARRPRERLFRQMKIRPKS